MKGSIAASLHAGKHVPWADAICGRITRKLDMLMIQVLNIIISPYFQYR